MFKAIQTIEDTIKFETRYISISWFVLESLLKHDVKRISQVVNKIMGKSIRFFGHSFGGYDIVIESYHKSPRVASWKTMQIQKELEMIKETTNVSYGPISCSLSLCRRIAIRKESFSEKLDQPMPLRAYVFIKTKAQLDKRKFMQLVKLNDASHNMDLMWNSSNHNLMLCIKGSCYYDIFSNIMQFRKDFDKLLVHTCSSFAVEWDSEANDFSSDIPKKQGKKILIPAVTYVKLRNPLDPKFKLRNRDWTPISGFDCCQYRRSGWLDNCLFIKKETLKEILTSVSRFREDNMEFVRFTSTVPLFPTEEEHE